MRFVTRKKKSLRRQIYEKLAVNVLHTDFNATIKSCRFLFSELLTLTYRKRNSELQKLGQ